MREQPSWTCSQGHEFHGTKPAGDGCPKCGSPLRYGSALTFVEKVKANIPESSKQFMDDALGDKYRS